MNVLDLMTPQDLKYVVCTTPPRFCGGFNAKCGITHHYRSRMELCNPILTLLGHDVVTSCLKKYSFFKRYYMKYTANAYRRTTDKLMFKSVISTVRWIRK